jgi:hypothetical protein
MYTEGAPLYIADWGGGGDQPEVRRPGADWGVGGVLDLLVHRQFSQVTGATRTLTQGIQTTALLRMRSGEDDETKTFPHRAHPTEVRT